MNEGPPSLEVLKEVVDRYPLPALKHEEYQTLLSRSWESLSKTERNELDKLEKLGDAVLRLGALKGIYGSIEHMTSNGAMALSVRPLISDS